MHSLRASLLAWVVGPMLIVAAISVWFSYRSAGATASLVHDRNLLSAARVMAERISEQDGQLEALIQPAALAMFESEERDRVFYRIVAPDGKMLAGYPDLAGPLTPPGTFDHAYYDAVFRVDQVRTVALAQPVVSSQASGNALVLVAETLRSREKLARDLWRRSLTEQLALIVAAAITILIGLRMTLRPLGALSSSLRQRDPDSLQVIDPVAVHAELRPMVEAMNHALSRVGNYIEAQRRFIANASHQLRTPIAVMKMQTTVGLQERSLQAKDEALVGIGTEVEFMARTVSQLLALARTEPGGGALRKQSVDFGIIVRTGLERVAPVALERGIDLGFVSAGGPLPVTGHETLLGELVYAIIENALTYARTAVEVRVEPALTSVVLIVEDDGPGIPADLRERVFERFWRAPAAAPGGSGLGLAIAREIAVAHNGTIVLKDRESQPGLAVVVTFPGG